MTWNTAMETAQEGMGHQLLQQGLSEIDLLSQGLREAYGEENKLFTSEESALARLNAMLSETIAATNKAKDAGKDFAVSVGDAVQDLTQNASENISSVLNELRQNIQNTENQIHQISSSWRRTRFQKERDQRTFLQTQLEQTRALEAELDRAIAQYDVLAAQAQSAGDTKLAAEYARESARLQSERSKTSDQIQKIEIQLDAPQLDSFLDQWKRTLVDLQDGFGTVAQNLANIVKDTTTAMRDGLSDFFYDSLSGAKKGKAALADMWIGMEKAALRAISNTISNFMMSKTVMLLMEYAWSASMLAVNAATNGALLAQETATAAAMSAMWSGPALLKSIATFGVAAVIGLTALMGVLAATGGFAKGGRITGPKQLAWFNEEGSEYVVSAASPPENDRFLDYANAGGRIEDLLRADYARSTSTSSTMTINHYSNNVQKPDRQVPDCEVPGPKALLPGPQVLPEVNVWLDNSRNTRRRAEERAQSKRLRQILRR